MRRVRLAAVLAAVAGALLLVPAPVSAGGPTSVLLVAPETGRTAALYNSTDHYEALQQALGADPVADTSIPEAPPHIGGSQIVVTWLVHDVHPWRVDRITLDTDGRPVRIHTQGSITEAFSSDALGVWHKPADPEALTGLLVDLGLIGQTSLRPTAEDPDEHAEAAAATSAGPPDDTAVSASVWALLPAVAGGIAVGVLGDRWLRRRRDRSDGGRWQLVDVASP